MNKIYFYTQEEFKNIVDKAINNSNIISILNYQNPEYIEEKDKKKHLVKESKENKNILTLDFDNITEAFDIYDKKYNIDKKAFSTFMACRCINFIEKQAYKKMDFYLVCDEIEISHAFAQFIVDFYNYLYEKPELKLTPNIEVLYKLRAAYREKTGEFTLLEEWREEMKLYNKMDNLKYKKRTPDIKTKEIKKVSKKKKTTTTKKKKKSTEMEEIMKKLFGSLNKK